MSRLDEEVALITGGASGLGLAIVKRFLKEGARVAVMDKSESALKTMRTQLGEYEDKRILTITGDVRSFDDNDRAITACVGEFGKLDCAIGNAGIWDFSVPLVNIPPETLSDSFDEMFRVNVLGYMNLAKAALKPLVASRGSLIYTVSNAGFHPDGGGPLYTATKHAVVGLIRQLAFEFGPYVRVNGVAPGAINTNLRGSESLGQSDRVIPGDTLEQVIPDAIPIGKLPTPDDYAGAYAFFACREDNVPSTGTILNHDGGVGVRGFGRPRAGDNLPDKLNLTEKE